MEVKRSCAGGVATEVWFRMLTFLLWTTAIWPSWCGAQTLTGIDSLGRVLPGRSQTGVVDSNKHVALFYFLWHEKAPSGQWDLSRIVAAHPEVLEDYDNTHWGGGGMYYWGEPLYGYYRADDYWVQLRNIQLLTDAGVDLLVIDATNGLIYARQAETLMKAMDAVRKQGRKPPQIAFYTHTASGTTIEKAYHAFYAPQAPFWHPACWYMLDGKPLIIGEAAEVSSRPWVDFFTYREPQWPNEPQKVNGWPWIDFVRPQRLYYNHRGEKEIVSVSVAQHPHWEIGMGGSAFYGFVGNWGRSYHHGKPGIPQDLPFGYNIQEQWDFAIAQQTPYVFVTGWNEWIACKFKSHDGNPEHSWFCDEASPEYSRDIEPTRTAGMNDCYYMQLMANIRRYKGVNPVPFSRHPVRVRGWDNWSRVEPEYRDYIGDASPRNYPGTPSDPMIRYVDSSGRNDLAVLKVAGDRRNLYFYAETTSALSPMHEKHWMYLWLDTDGRENTGWMGFDYRVKSGRVLERYREQSWEKVGVVTSRVNGRQLMITIQRHALGIAGFTSRLGFKWSDNMKDEDDPMDWYLHGDAAPGGRLCYLYQEKP